MPQPNYGYLDPYSSEASEIERQRRYADALREQAGTPITPYSAGGITAPISWTQGAAKLLQGYNAGAAGRQAEEQAKALRKRYGDDLASVLRRAERASVGAPATSETIMDEQANGGMGAQATINAPAREGDSAAAAGIYMEHPMTQAIGLSERKRQMEAAALRKQLEQFFPQVQGAGQAPAVGVASAPGGAPQVAPGGINPVDPRLLALSMTPGGAPIANLISGREIAAGKQGIDMQKLRQTVREFEELSANQKAELALKGIKNGLDLAEARDKGIDVSGLVSPAASAPAVPAPAGTSTQETFRGAAPNDAEAIRMVRDLSSRGLPASIGVGYTPSAPGAAPAPRAGMSPRGAREAVEAGAQVEEKERAKLRVEMPETRQRMQIQTQDLDRLSKAATEIIGTNLSRASGALGAVPSWPGGSAAQAESLITSLKSQVSGMKLQAMREASKTGGAVGQVTEREWPRLENMIVALDPVKQGPKLFKQKLTELIEEIEKTKGSLSQAFKTQYGEDIGSSGNSGGGGGVGPFSDPEKERRYQEYKRSNGL